MKALPTATFEKLVELLGRYVVMRGRYIAYGTLLALAKVLS